MVVLTMKTKEQVKQELAKDFTTFQHYKMGKTGIFGAYALIHAKRKAKKERLEREKQEKLMKQGATK